MTTNKTGETGITSYLKVENIKPNDLECGNLKVESKEVYLVNYKKNIATSSAIEYVMQGLFTKEEINRLNSQGFIVLSVTEVY